ncbi:uncharacterized protein [Primulina eburnea]|uniref:uncharacterized protein n=1 Tax=Primulina eburnea TaxID=1245227 RepID=UPI003C6C8C54
MEGLKECEANMVMYLNPCKAKSPTDAILRELSSLLFTYSETFDGVVLAYDPNVRSNWARILPGVHPYFGVKLKARLLLFNPKPDMLLGSLTTASSECARRLDKNLDKWSQTDSTSKKRKVNEGIKNPEGDRLMINKKIIGEDEMPEEGMTMVKRKQLYGKMTSRQIKRSKKGRKDQS